MSEGISEGAEFSSLGETFRRLLRRFTRQQSATPMSAAEEDSGKAVLRRSSGLREFWKVLQGAEGLKILDLGPASQANVSFITGLGHKLYTADLLQAIQRFIPGEKQQSEVQADLDQFFRENLNYSEGQFDGVLCWDVFDFVAEPILKSLVQRMHWSIKPGGAVLSFFHTGPAGQEVPLHSYRIRAEDTLQVISRGGGRLHRHFNNRTIETLFTDFASIKFYLARDNLREVISFR